MSSAHTVGRKRSALLPTLVIAIVLLLAFLGFSAFWTDKLWFDSLEYSAVFTTRVWSTVGLWAAFGLFAALVIAGNAALAYSRRPPFRASPLNSPLLQGYHQFLEKRSWVFVVAAAVVSLFFAGGYGAAHWDTFLAWWNGEPFGVTDPQFGFDVSFFVFGYPWYSVLAMLVCWTLLFAVLVSALVHYVSGGMSTVNSKLSITGFAEAHLAILVGLFMLAVAGYFWLSRFGLSVESKALLTGMTYVDDNVRLQARTITAIVAVLCAVLFFLQPVLHRWIIPMVGVGLMLLSLVLIAGAYPALVQSFSVNPDEPDKERPYIERNIAATRDAYGLNNIDISDYSATSKATVGQLRADAEALPGIRLIDPALIGPAFEQLQQVRGYYSFPKTLDVDRYDLNGDRTDAVVAAREMDLAGLQSQSWNNLHTVYTHGYGMVAAYGNRRQPGGEPDWIVRDIPPTGALAEHEPRTYFGELHTDYSIVGAPANQAPIELDTPGGGKDGNPKLYTYTGKGGVPIGNLFTKLLYAVRFGDVNIMLSERVNPESKIIYDRTPRERVQKAAPWLTVDTNAFPAIVDGRLVWIVDGYTTSDSYPNSHRVSLEAATADSESRPGTVGSQPDQTINYLRNSVKAVVDAYDGTVKLYAWQPDDPILKTWQKVYPGAVTDRSKISADLLQHLRYPEDQFKVQREVLGRYHVTDPHVWYQQTDRWEIPDDPVVGKGMRETPYYLSVKWPGDKEPVFSQTTVFVPKNRQNLAAYMAINADASSKDYGKIRILRMSDKSQIDGPGQTFNAMTTDNKVSARLRQYLNQGSANAKYGNLLTLPVGGGLLYVQPVYAERQATTASYPTLQLVIVRFGEHVGIGVTLQEALDEVFGGDAGADTGEKTSEDAAKPDEKDSGTKPPPSKPDATPEQIQQAGRELLAADKKFAEADQALKQGDLATYQQRLTEGRAAVKRAQQLFG